MGDQLLAKRYAMAIFDLAKEEEIVDQIGGDLELLGQLLTENRQWIDIVDDENLSLKRKIKMVDEISAKANFHHHTSSFLKMLTERHKVYLLEEICSAYKKMNLVFSGVVESKITVADISVFKKLKKEIEATVKTITGLTPILECKVDPAIIGGLTIEIGDKIYDGSIKRELINLKAKLMSGKNKFC